MGLVRRVLDETPCPDLAAYVARGGGRGLDAARRLGPDGILDEIDAAGLRGHGGAGFPTATKWRTVAASRSPVAPTSVVVNGAEGEPGTFKDRALLRANPYKVIEGALIAAIAVEASEVVVGVKRAFEREVAALTYAMRELHEAGWAPDIGLRVVEGPSSYLFGEETALLEVVGGRQPFPRVDPPFRRGIDPGQTDVGHSASRVQLAAVGGSAAPPALVNNVETMANVADILANGPDWYRSVGSAGSPGTLVCTITGHTRRHAVGEVPMGTTLREAIDLIGGGPRAGHTILAVLSGVANPIIPGELLDTPLTFEAMAAIGSGLGAGGFIVFQDGTDLVAVAQRAARFLAVESCGQCEPCKRDGLAISELLTTVLDDAATGRERRALDSRLRSVTRGARCSLASQQERVVGSILRLVEAPTHGNPDGADFLLPLVDIVDGAAVLDTTQRAKQPDWTYDARDSASWPAARLGNQPVVTTAPLIREDLDAGPMDAVATVPVPAHQLVDGLFVAHRDLEALVDAASAASPQGRPARLRALSEGLRAHIDVTQRVLYPMVRRVAGAAGDAASGAAEHTERSGLQLAELLATTTSDAAAADAAMQRLAQVVRAHIDAEQAYVIPLLRDHLDREELDALAEGMNEARLRRQPPSTREAFNDGIANAPGQKEAS